jgi:curli biogenesis system outer membrane secretion channel CsgG
MGRLHRSRAVSLIVVCSVSLGGCLHDSLPSATPQVNARQPIDMPPPPPRALTIGVYNCIDTTGQRRPTGVAQELSTAVPMDCTPYLVEAISSLRPGYVFLVERQHLDELLRERQLATLALNAVAQAAAATAAPATAAPVAGTPGADKPAQGNAPAVQPRRLSSLRVAEVLLVGQVVAYDRSTKQISAGLALGAVGIDSTLVTDLVTFSLRAIAVQTGEVIGETTATKSITSMKLGGYIAKIFPTSTMESELGGAGNEPVGLALQAAIHSALDHLVQNGIHDGWWT